ncbi:MFS transporter [Effusibacillus consociatus]|uniref:MFS transporter n=1 Tax=Effusibacillus consociatus TaxID=1117041 RepID=A0ABV9PZ21_9BACL
MEGRSVSFGLYVLVGVLLNVTALGFARFAYGVVMPFMREGLSLSYAQAGMLGTSTALGYLGMVIFAGLLTARWGAKLVVMLGGAGISVSLLGLVWAPSYEWALGMMFLSGVGTALTFTPLIALLVAWFPERRGIVIGFMSSGAGIGMFTAGSLVPIFVEIFPVWGWRSAWAFFGMWSVLVTLLAAFIFKNPPLQKASPEAAVLDPVAEVYKKKEVLRVGIIYFLLGVAYMIPMTFLVGFMLEREIDPAVAGRVVAGGGFLSILSGPLWGMVSDRIGRRTALLISFWAAGAGTSIPVIAPHLVGFVVGQIVLGCTVGGMLSLVQAAATEQVRPPLIGVALGYVTVFFALGQLIGPGAAGWIIDHFGGFQAAFLFSCGMILVGTLFASYIPRDVNSSAAVSQAEYK